MPLGGTGNEMSVLSAFISRTEGRLAWRAWKWALEFAVRKDDIDFCVVENVGDPRRA